MKPEDVFVQAPSLAGNQLIESIQVKFDDQEQIEHLEQKAFHKNMVFPATRVKVHFRTLKGRAFFDHRIHVHMESRLSLSDLHKTS